MYMIIFIEIVTDEQTVQYIHHAEGINKLKRAADYCTIYKYIFAAWEFGVD